MSRIALIEDDEANSKLMRYLLIAGGHTVLSASDGLSGIALVCSERPDIVLCDIRLPKLDGVEVLRAIRAEHDLESMPVIAVTAFAMRDDRARFLAAGFTGYLEKPIAARAFLGQVEAFLRDRPLVDLLPSMG